MIVTVTINPAMDRTLDIQNLKPYGLNIVNHSILDAGGKGINVSKTIESLSGQSIATGFLGGETGAQIKRKLDDMHITHDFVEVKGETRTNIKVYDKESQLTTELNEIGPEVTLDDLERLMTKLKNLISKDQMVVLSGSVPKSLPRDTYRRLIECVHGQGGIAFLDASGDVFEQALSAKPDYIKPNRHELEMYMGKVLTTDSDFISAGKHFLEMGIRSVLFSLGEEGAYYIDRENAFRLLPLKVEAHSTVGAGDAFVGAFAYGIDSSQELSECLKLAVATSAGAVTTLGTKPVDHKWVMSHLEHVEIRML